MEAVESFRISSTVQNGLQNLDTSTVPLDVARKLIATCVALMLRPKATVPSAPPVPEQATHQTKQSEYAVTTLLALACRHCCDGAALRQQLEQHSLSAAITEELVRVYEDNRSDLVLRQLQLGQTFPHISDVQWRIVCDVKSSTSESSSSEVGFQINLGRYDVESGERITIAEFLCNTEELQLLISKLKEIERHCERVAEK